MGPLLLDALIVLCLATVSAATVALVVVRARSRARVGRVLYADVERLPLRRLVALVVVLGALVVTLVHPTPQWPALVAMLALAALNVVLAPAPGDAVCGEGGVRRGWYSRSFADLEEWRLTGDHLRFRLFGIWTSAPLPRTDQGPVRATLERAAPERESALKH